MNKLILSLVITFTTIQFLHAQDFGYDFVTDFGSSNWETIASTVLDEQGNAYICGSFTDTLELGAYSKTSNGKRDVFVAKIDKDGKVQWLENYGGAYDDNAYSLIEENGNIYIVGSFKEKTTLGTIPLLANGFTDVFFAKIDAGGIVTNALTISSSSTAQKAFLQKNAVGEIMIAGTFKKDITINSNHLNASGKTDIFYATYDETQNSFKNEASFGGTDEDRLFDFLVSPADELYFAGSFKENFAAGTINYTSAGKTDAFFIKIDNTGQTTMGKQFGGVYNEQLKKIALDAQNNIYLAGEYEHAIAIDGANFSTTKKRDVFLVKLNTEGNFEWKTQLGSTAYTTISSLEVAGINNFYITGGFRGTLNEETSARNSKDAYIALYQTNGTQSWLKKAGHNYEDNLQLKRYSTGELFISGFFSNAFELKNDNASYAVDFKDENYKDLFVGKLIDCQTMPGPDLEDVTVCEGESVTLDAGAGYTSYEWLNAANETIGTAQTIIITSGGTYTIKVGSESGCGSSTVDINFAPITVSDLVDDQSSCSAVELVAPEGYTSYSWNDGSFSDITTYTADQTGIVKLTVKDNTNCLTDDIQVTINNDILVNLEPNIVLCEGESVTLDAGSGYTSYEWTNTTYEIIGTTQTLVVSTGGNYSVTVSDATGCGSTSTEVTVNQPPYFDFPATTWIQADYVLDPGLIGDYSYSWNNGESIASTFTLVYGHYGRASYVNLIVTDNGGCGTYEDQTLVRQGTPPASIVQGEENNDNTTTELNDLDKNSLSSYKVYPNPSTGRFHIYVPEPDNVKQVDIFNLRGDKIRTYKSNFRFPLEVILHGQAKGVYVVKVSVEKNAYELRLILN